MNKLNFEIAIYEVFQMVLIDRELLDKKGKPFIKKNRMTLDEQQAIELYTKFAERIRGSNQDDFRRAKEEFNKYAKMMHDEVFLNMYLMSLFMLDAYIEDQDKPTQIALGGKIRRLIRYLREKILELEERGSEIIVDSSMAASNIYRAYNGLPELTREVREARANKWRNVAKNREKK